MRTVGRIIFAAESSSFIRVLGHAAAGRKGHPGLLAFFQQDVAARHPYDIASVQEIHSNLSQCRPYPSVSETITGRPSGHIDAADTALLNLWNFRDSTLHQRVRPPDANVREKPLCRPIAEAQRLADWYRVLESRALRMDSPDEYHEELLRQADEMDRRGIICWQEWRDLRLEADAAYLRAVAGEDYRPVNPTSSSAK